MDKWFSVHNYGNYHWRIKVTLLYSSLKTKVKKFIQRNLFKEISLQCISMTLIWIQWKVLSFTSTMEKYGMPLKIAYNIQTKMKKSLLKITWLKMHWCKKFQSLMLSSEVKCTTWYYTYKLLKIIYVFLLRGYFVNLKTIIIHWHFFYYLLLYKRFYVLDWIWY